MGAERSLAKVGQRLGVSTQYLERLSSKNQWRARTEAYDAHIAHFQAEDEISNAVKTNRRHIEESQAMQLAVLKFLTDFDPNDLKASDAAQWLKAAIEIERKCMGLDNEAPHVGVQVNLALAQIPNEGVMIEDVMVNRRQLLICTRLYPRALTMLTEEQRAALDRFKDGLPEAE